MLLKDCKTHPYELIFYMDSKVDKSGFLSYLSKQATAYNSTDFNKSTVRYLLIIFLSSKNSRLLLYILSLTVGVNHSAN